MPENYIFIPTLRNKMSNRSRVQGSEVGLFVSFEGRMHENRTIQRVQRFKVRGLVKVNKKSNPEPLNPYQNDN